MININEGEKILKIVRRHTWILATSAIVFFTLALAPLAGFAILKTLVPLFQAPLTNAYWIAYLVFLLFVFLKFILAWMNYYLDFWIITDRKIIDIQFTGIFSHAIAEFPVTKIQDVTVRVDGMMPVFLGYGDVLIKTASENTSLRISQIPDPIAIKDVILNLLTKKENHVGTLTVDANQT